MDNYNCELEFLFKSVLRKEPADIQLFSKRLSVKGYATIPKGFMGKGCLQLSDRISRCISPQEGYSMNLRTHAIYQLRSFKQQ